MIIDLGRDSSARYSFVICLEREVNRPDFMRNAKVKPGSYAWELFSGVYEGIFHRSLELKHDYSKYYSVEYATFSEYLRKRFRFGPEVISRVAEQFGSSSTIVYFEPAHCFLEEDFGLNLLETLLEPWRKK